MGMASSSLFSLDLPICSRLYYQVGYDQSGKPKSHYCNQENVNELLAIDDKIFEDAIVLCKYTNGGRPDKCASVKPHGALAVLQFSDPFDYSHGDETGFPNDAGTGLTRTASERWLYYWF